MDPARPEDRARTDVVSVVVPAHNEETVVGRCLTALLDGAGDEQLEVVVVCNGCTDRTAEVAAAFGPPVRVVETAEASKPDALNAGDRAAVGFPRFYVDADVELSGTALLAVAEVLRSGEALAAAPALQMDLTGRTWSVRAYYRVWTQLPYVRHDLVGRGVYALSEAGRSRFDHFPSIIADDLFVRNRFAPGERKTVEEAVCVVRSPASLAALVRVKSRARAGDIQYARLLGGASHSNRPDRAAAFRALAGRPSLWPSLGAYVAVASMSWARAAWKVGRADLGRWDRDETARAGGVLPTLSVANPAQLVVDDRGKKATGE